jgi:hypothetical protein
MTKDNGKTAPYAPIGSVLSVVRRYREHGAPKTIDLTEITRVGVSEGNASRTLVAMKFLGLVEKDGKLSDKFTLLNKATTDEYPNVLADIVRGGYSDIFTILNPSNATEIQITDAFRGYEPGKQRSRMVQLFIGLCQEAKIMEGKPTIVEGRKYTPSTPSTGNGGEKKKHQQVDFQQPPKVTNYWSIKFDQYLEDLPTSDKRVWTKTKRDKWINAVTAMLDYLIEVNEENS